MSSGVLGRLSLAQRFAIAGAVVLLIGSLVIGTWVVRKISEGVTTNAAISTALLIDGLITPLAQELKDSEVLSIGPVRALDEVLRNRLLRERVLSIKIWKPDGLIAYSDNFDIIGQRFEPSEPLGRALAGEVVAELDRLEDPESAREEALGISMLEIYSPIRDQWSGEVIAVAEFYEDAGELESTLSEARRDSWLVVGSTTAAMALVLFGIVMHGSRTIASQRRTLEQRMAQTAAVSDQNRALRERIERAYSLSTELNERYLRRVSADLHDGPAQLVGLAALRVGSLRDADDSTYRASEARLVQQVLSEAMTDIRTICSGLSLPHIEKQSLGDIVGEVSRGHERRTHTEVHHAVSGETAELPLHIKICVYRFLQEGLNNAYRHAGGAGQAVRCHVEDGILHALVANGPFACADDAPLQALEALGGRFHFEASPGSGSRLEMSVRFEKRIAA
jgi:signal transduction histidine kinase